MITVQPTEIELYKNAIQRRYSIESRTGKNFGALERQGKKPQLPSMRTEQLGNREPLVVGDGSHAKLCTNWWSELSNGIRFVHQLRVRQAVYGHSTWHTSYQRACSEFGRCLISHLKASMSAQMFHLRSLPPSLSISCGIVFRMRS